MNKRAAYLAAIFLLLLTLLALALRLYRIGAQSLWYDEGYSAVLARESLSGITARTAADIQPPLYYYLLHGWIRLFGEGESALRALSLLFGVLTVPLIFAVAVQLFKSRGAGIVAALLAAISPLHIWYSQEVRMYTLLTFLVLLSSSLLLSIVRRVSSRSPNTGEQGVWQEILLWSGFALASVAALYTHYFAFFILGFQGVYVLLVWARGQQRSTRLIIGGAISGAVTMLAYVPWLPHLLTRYGADTSYWPGQLKLREVLVDIGISYVGGESVTEQFGVRAAIGCGVVLIICLAALLWRSRRMPEVAARRSPDSASRAQAPHPGVPVPAAFLLLYLLVPPALILLLSYNAPKFNARYVMLSHPAMLLILAGGLAGLWQGRTGVRPGRLGRLVAVLALVFVAGVSAKADYGAYATPDFSRADFRGVAQYIRENIQLGEAVILSSGHMYPVFDFYAPGVQRYLLPDSPTLDTTLTLDYSIAGQLNQWLVGKSGVWLVLWQNDVIDPVGYLSSMIDAVGQEESIGASFSEISVRHFRLPSKVRFSDQPQIDHPAGVNFGNHVRLLGYNQSGPQQVTLFWQPLHPLTEDYMVSVRLRDTNNQVWGQWNGRPGRYSYPTSRWRTGQIVPDRYDLVPLEGTLRTGWLLPGTPPGDYGLDVSVYTEREQVGLDVLDQAGAPQGKRATLGAVRLDVPPATPEELQVANEVRAKMGGGLTLLGWDLDRAAAQPGDRLLLTLFWSVESQPQGDYWVRLLATDAVSQTLEAGAFAPAGCSACPTPWPTTHWQPGQAWRGQSTFRLPIKAQPGQARLSVQLVAAHGAPLGPTVDLGHILVLTTDRSFVEPRPQVPRETDFNRQITLVGADLGPDPVGAGSVLTIILYWKAEADMDVPYTAFVHVLDADGHVVAGHDGQPAGGARPTTGWVPGEFVVDRHDVQIPVGLPPGEYVLEVGLYDAGATHMPRLPVVDDEGTIETDRVIFGPVEVQ